MMESLYEIRQRFLDRIEPILSHALAAQDQKAAKACLDFLGLFAQPDYELFNAAEYIRGHAKALSNPQWRLEVSPIREDYVGSPTLMMTCLQALLRAIHLEADSQIHIEVFEGEDRGDVVPMIGIGLEGPGSVPKMVVMQGYFRMPLKEFGACWTLATQGGRIDETENGLCLRLAGMRMPPEPLPEATELLVRLGKEPSAQDLESALAYLDGEKRYEPGDISALFVEVLEGREEVLRQESIRVESDFPEELPPLAMYRNRLRVFFTSLLDYSGWVLPPNSTVQVLAEYESRSRTLSFLITLSAQSGRIGAGLHHASLARAVAAHDGDFDLEAGEREITITAILPDTVGSDVDAWIPGWEAFSARSQQMLRLLKSGGETPPEDFLLGAILESELEGLLLAKLSAPAAMNVAHELKPYSNELPGSDAQRLKKALEQVTRGKVKKEICAPPYAAELIWAFRSDARSKGALGILVLEEEEIRSLCEGLLAKPPAQIDCLRLLAKIAQSATV